MSFINRQLFCSIPSSKVEYLFEQGNKIVEKIFYLLDFAFFKTCISVYKYSGIGRMIHPCMKVNEILVFKIGDVFGISSRFDTV